MKLDVLTVGNAVLDVFLSLQQADKQIHLDRQTKSLCLPYGEKILVESSSFLLGGNASNVAVGLKRLGLTTALMAEIGMDEFSAKILTILRREEVLTDYVQRKEGESSMTVGINFQGERTLFVQHRKREHDFRFSAVHTDWIYLTSLGDEWQHVYQEVSEYLSSHEGVKLAFNPGSVQQKEGLESFSHLLPQTDVLFVNREEAVKMVGQEQTIEDLLQSLKDMGPVLVVITDGEKGSYALGETGGVVYQEKIPCTVHERTGAGDAYASGMLAALIHQKPLQEAMLWGAKNAASVIEHVGAQQGLLFLDDIEKGGK